MSATKPAATSGSAYLPRLRHTIMVSEENGEIVLDITDETGGLGIKLFLGAAEAHRMGYSMMERARMSVSKATGDPGRAQKEQFAGETKDAT